jgi:hypothetical protein
MENTGASDNNSSAAITRLKARKAPGVRSARPKALPNSVQTLMLG